MDNLFYQPNIQDGIHFLDPEESRHCYKVLRRKVGDAIHITDGKGVLYDAVLTETKPDKCSFKVQSSRKEEPKKYQIHIAIAPTKNPDRIEWFVEKAVEICVDEISFILCDKSERAAMKTERIEKLAISAMKQSLKPSLPKINHMCLFIDFIIDAKATDKFIAYVDHTNPNQLLKVAKPGSEYIVMIGPEGDFSKKEIELAMQHQYKKIGLGPSRLRTETAGMVSCHILNLVNQ
jgi:16S rRNA (uracil1498-N3)-methyltransferase